MWKTTIKKKDVKLDASLEVNMNKAISDIRSMMQPFHEAGLLDYDEHIMAFTDITDKIMNIMMANVTELDATRYSHVSKPLDLDEEFKDLR